MRAVIVASSKFDLVTLTPNRKRLLLAVGEAYCAISDQAEEEAYMLSLSLLQSLMDIGAVSESW